MAKRLGRDLRILAEWVRMNTIARGSSDLLKTNVSKAEEINFLRSFVSYQIRAIRETLTAKALQGDNEARIVTTYCVYIEPELVNLFCEHASRWLTKRGFRAVNVWGLRTGTSFIDGRTIFVCEARG